MGTTQVDTVPEPKYWHLKTVLSEALDTEFAVGQVLPNERDLAARYGVARATLRQALEQLELEGRLQRRRGVGTTVAPPRMGVDVATDPGGWPGTAEDAWRVEDCSLAAPPAAVARLLADHPPGPCHVLRRVRSERGQHVATEVLYVPGGVTGEVPGSGPARGGAVLSALHRLELDGQDRSVELGAARADDARRLDRLPGSPVLVVTTRYVAGGTTVAVAVATYRADTCRLTFGGLLDADLLAG
ncbi:GntR family transcriptional regulator [Streptomyces chumphonensis]|uniref:GntR family transcriptional regulator n=1 Tax=Streptomyces chumphonensis TaxID=1214925 RepID=A0A927F279_9ACTN|nr:GntR family transcriptional regulator [Streptomyces chumphonensis]MBD3933896.1 GntR family transcriptional regulator [Streptomyces chumphonensis]